jgi:antitoxin (DNA-binding transcriptional repressor) of toxin-antitoxin stability system
MFNSRETAGAMREISMLEFRKNAEAIIAQIRRGERMVLTYRGRPVVRLEPVEGDVSPDDPFYSLNELAVSKGRSLSNEQIDRIVYGP